MPILHLKYLILMLVDGLLNIMRGFNNLKKQII